jgi:hypothetical protein
MLAEVKLMKGLAGGSSSLADVKGLLTRHRDEIEQTADDDGVRKEALYVLTGL